jgi:hypothetical protein
MKRGTWALIATVILFLGLDRPAKAQYPGYNPNPYSPYLNLFRRGGSLTSNYWGLVRPEQQFDANIQQLQRQQLVLAKGAGTIEVIDQGISTGVVAGFGTHWSYFGVGGPQSLNFQNSTINTRPYTATSTPAGPAQSQQPTRIIINR